MAHGIISSVLMLVGLGNPGVGYSQTRHNIGFMVIDEIAQHYRFPAFHLKDKAEISQGDIHGKKVLLVKPLSFMNLSGEVVQKVAHFYKIPVENITVFHDDLDLLPGRIRVKIGGGHGGHNGLRSLDRHIGVNYRRVRVGIGRPADQHMASTYVLSNFLKDELSDKIQPLINLMVSHIGLLLEEKNDHYMSKIAYEIEGKRE